MTTLTDEITAYLDEDFSNPFDAKGKCYEVTERVLYKFTELDWIVADHSNSAMRRWEEFGQHSDHYAAYHDNTDTVIDYTMRQFDAESSYPYVGTRDEWLTALAKVWDTEDLRTIVGWSSLSFSEDDFEYDEEYDQYEADIEFWSAPTNQ